MLAFTLVNWPPVRVNSSDAMAYHQDSSGVSIASRYDITGGFVNSGGAIVLGQVHTGVRPTPDPLSLLPIPDTAGVPVRSNTPKTVNSFLPLPVILQPGIYRGGSRITGISIVMMQPGVYIMEGGGFRIDTAAIVTGLEVMIYNTTSGTYASGPISVSGLGYSEPHGSPVRNVSRYQRLSESRDDEPDQLYRSWPDHNHGCRLRLKSARDFDRTRPSGWTFSVVLMSWTRCKSRGSVRSTSIWV